MAVAQASLAQCLSSGQQNVCKALTKNQLNAFDQAILKKETGQYSKRCTIANGGCQDRVGDPAAAQKFTPSLLNSLSGYTLIPLGASGGGNQELYYNQLYYLVQSYNNKSVIKNCETSSPHIQAAPAFSSLSAALNRANNTGVLFGKMPELLAPPKYYQKVEKVKGKPKKIKAITPEYIAYQKIITAIQGSKTSPAATAAKLRPMIISYIENYGYGNVPSMSLLPSKTTGNITTSELETGLNKSEITNMFVYALFMKYRNANLSQYFQPPMTSGYNYYTGIGPFAGGGDDDEAKYDFMTQAMLHSASAVPTKSGQVNLTWSTHSNLTKYLIEIDETHGVSHQMTKCFLDIAHQNLITNPKTFSSQDCSKGIISTCSVAGVNIPLWVLRAAETQNAGSSPTTCSPALTDLGTPNDPYYPATAGQDYMHYYQLLHSKSSTTPATS